MNFSIGAVILFAFCFRLNIFASKISNLLLLLGADRVGVVNLNNLPYFSLLLLVAYLLEHNVDEKNMRNTEVKASIEISLDSPPKKDSRQNLDPQNILTHAENQKILNHVKKLTHAKKFLTHATHVKIMTT